MSAVYVVEVVASLRAGRHLSDDEITDIIEMLVDDLDRSSVDPSVGTVRRDDDVDVTVAVTVDDAEELDAMAHGLAAIRAAFHAAGIGTAGVAIPRDLRSRIVPLQSA